VNAKNKEKGLNEVIKGGNYLESKERDTKSVIAKYKKSKATISILEAELDVLEALLKEEPLCVSHCQMSEYKTIIEKTYHLKLKIGTNQAFVAKIDALLNILKERFDENDYEMFVFRHLENNSLSATSKKFNYADASGSSRRIKKIVQVFEELISSI